MIDQLVHVSIHSPISLSVCLAGWLQAQRWDHLACALHTANLFQLRTLPNAACSRRRIRPQGFCAESMRAKLKGLIGSVLDEWETGKQTAKCDAMNKEIERQC